MNRSYAKKPALFDILLSLLVDPRGTTNRLFRGSYSPPWVVTTFLLFLCVCVAPPLVFMVPESTDPLPLRKIGAVVMAVLLTTLASTFFMSMGLRSFNDRSKAYSVFAALVYATAPIVAMMLAALLANRILEGSLSLVSFLATGVSAQDDLIVTLFPHLIHLSLIGSLITLAHSLRALTRSSLSVALLMAIGSVPLILGSFVVGLTATDLLIPASSPETITLFRTLFQLPT